MIIRMVGMIKPGEPDDILLLLAPIATRRGLVISIQACSRCEVYPLKVRTRHNQILRLLAVLLIRLSDFKNNQSGTVSTNNSIYLSSPVRDRYTNATRANERTTSMTVDIVCFSIV